MLWGISPSNYDTIAKSDASKIRWGAMHESTQTGCRFSNSQKDIHIKGEQHKKIEIKILLAFTQLISKIIFQ